MKKIIELCGVLYLGALYLILTTKVAIEVKDVLILLQFICEILRITLSIAGFILVYQNAYTKMDHKANYIAVTLLQYCILFVVGMKCYLFPENAHPYGEDALYRFVLECFQISMVMIAMKYINEQTHLKKYFTIQLTSVIIVTLLMLHPGNTIGYLFDNRLIQVICQGMILSVLFIALKNDKKVFDETYTLRNKMFMRLLWIKGLISVLEIIKVIKSIDGAYWISLAQYLLQVVFIMWIIAYIDECALGKIWRKMDYGVEDKRRQMLIRKDEQSVLVMAAEEIKMHINSIIERVEKLETNLKTDAPRHLEKIKTNSYRLFNLSENIFKFNEYELKGEEVHFKVINLKEHIGNIVSSIEPYIHQKGISLEYITSEDMIMAEVDPDSIERIVLNLISNAVKYNKKNGGIQVILSKKRKCIYLCIKDSGIGIATYDLDSIFDKFKRVDSKDTHIQEGSGLGLSIVKSLVELHDGQIQVVSSEGKGTIISIELPCRQEGLK